MSGAKTALTAAALTATGYSRLAGKKMEKAGRTPAEGTTEPAGETPDEVSAAPVPQLVPFGDAQRSCGLISHDGTRGAVLDDLEYGAAVWWPDPHAHGR
jgi:hypothetical protein